MLLTSILSWIPYRCRNHHNYIRKISHIKYHRPMGWASNSIEPSRLASRLGILLLSCTLTNGLSSKCILNLKMPGHGNNSRLGEPHGPTACAMTWKMMNMKKLTMRNGPVHYYSPPSFCSSGLCQMPLIFGCAWEPCMPPRSGNFNRDKEWGTQAVQASGNDMKQFLHHLVFGFRIQ